MALSTVSVLLLTLSSIASVAYGGYFTRQEPGIAKVVIKTIPLTCLFLISLITGGPWPLTAGLLFGASGDAFLALPEEKGFLAGLGSFLLGHLCFAALFFQTGLGADILSVELWRTLCSFGLVILGGGMVYLLYPNLGKLRVPVLLYILTILVMGLLALTLPLNSQMQLVMLGAMLFIASDTILAFELFLLDKDASIRAITSRVLWFAYWVGQVLILWGVIGFALQVQIS